MKDAIEILTKKHADVYDENVYSVHAELTLELMAGFAEWTSRNNWLLLKQSAIWMNSDTGFRLLTTDLITQFLNELKQ